MSIINPANQISKSFTKRWINKEAGKKVAQEFTDAFKKLHQGNLDRQADASNQLKRFDRIEKQAKKTLAENARITMADAYPPASYSELNRAEHTVYRNHKLLENLPENRASVEAQGGQALYDDYVLSRIKIKDKKDLGLSLTGNEYAQVKSAPVLYEKHPVIKRDLPVREPKTTAEKYVEQSQEFAGRFIEALDQRTPFVSPRLAQRGKDPEKALKQYETAVSQFEDSTINQEAQALAAYAIHTKVLKNGKFRIKAQHPEAGQLTAKFKYTPDPKQKTDAAMAQHIQEGMNKAKRLASVLYDENTSPYISRHILRTNAITKNLKEKGLAHFEAAREALNTPEAQRKIAKLEENDILVKVLRDGNFRITRYNEEGAVVKTRHIGLLGREKDKNAFIQKCLDNALELGNQPLPEKISTKQQLKNKFNPIKKGILNFFD